MSAKKPKRGFPDNKTQLKYQHLQLRIQAFEKYGGCKCTCPRCGETDLEFLSLDHINLDGGAHRREVSPGRKDWGGHHLFRLLRRQGWPPGYQVLCMNCNFGRTRNGGVCPHISPSRPLNERLVELESLRGISSQSKLFQDASERAF
jgi:hypothetical protein